MKTEQIRIAVSISALLAIAAGPGSRATIQRPHAKPLTPGAMGASANRPQLDCAAPTLAECKSAQYRRSRCGKLAMAATRTDPNAPCNVLFGNAAQAYAQQLPVKLVVAPAIRSASGVVSQAAPLAFGGCDPGAGRTCARVPAVNYNGFSVTGLESLAISDSVKRSAFMASTNLSSAAQTFRSLDSLRLWSWEQNGNQVASCREYVWEKYYDYSLFEAATAASGGEARNVYDVAYGNLDSHSSIASRALASISLKQRDGWPMDPAIAFPTGQVKNTFFETVLATPPSDGPDLAMAVPCMNRNRVAPYGVSLNDPVLEQTLRMGPLHNESFAWHKEMNDALAADGSLDEELYALEQVKLEYRDLLNERVRLQKYFSAWFQSVVNKANDETYADNDPLAGLDDPALELGYLVAMAQQDLTIPTAGAVGETWDVLPAPDFTSLVPATGEDLTSGLALLAEAMCVDQAISPVEKFMVSFAAIDARIEAALHRASDLGCLNLANPHSPCDWSPNLFKARVVGLYGTEREEDYQRCLDYTANNFNKLINKTFPVPNAPPTCTPEDFRASPRRVEEYERCIDLWCQQVVAAIESALNGKILDPATGKLRIGKSTVGASEIGGDIAGSKLDYGSDFRVDGFDVNPDAADASQLSMMMEGHVNASVSLFGISVDLMTSSYKMTNQQVDVDMRVIGMDIYPDAVEQQFASGTLSPVADSRSWSTTFVEASVVVPVLIIPVTVRGWITGYAALTYNASALRQSTPVANQLVALVTPGVGVDAGISASVDAVILEIGVKGQIAVLHLDFPMAAGLTIGQPNNEPDVMLAIVSKSDITLSSLSGYMAVFGEIDFGLWSESMEVPLFSWGGLSISKNFYDVAIDGIPVEPLFMVAKTLNH